MNGEPEASTDRPERNPPDARESPPWRSLAVVMGPSVLAAIYAMVGTLATIFSVLAPPRRLPRPALSGGALLPWAYVLLVRPWHLTWGVTDEEAHRALPYDHFVPRPIFQTTRAITIDAPAGQVWRWLVQVGRVGAGCTPTTGWRTWRTSTSIALKRSSPSCKT